MKKVRVKASTEYDILIEKGLLKNCGSLIRGVSKAEKVALISDNNVGGLYGMEVGENLGSAGFSVSRFIFDGGEESKSPKTLFEILEFLAKQEFTRKDIIVALGGGITGDIAGFAAAVYQRGIAYIQIPTTLLAAVDSSVGGKTAVNLEAGKNQAGAFHQPSLVICDPEVFATLSEEEFGNGLAEAIKYGVIGNESLFEKLEQGEYKEPAAALNKDIEGIIEQCVGMKRDIVGEDEFDTGKRQLLNLGHTFGHAIEKCSHYDISHGRAVAIGMYMVAAAAEKRGICPAGTSERIKTALENNGLPWKCEFAAEDIAAAVMADKKRAGGSITFVLPEKVGKCSLKPIDVSEVRTLLKWQM